MNVVPTGALSLDEKVISLYVAHQKIYPRSVKGVFTTWRWLFVYLTQLVFYGLPWLQWGNRPSVLFDLEARRFYLFSLVLYPQDFVFLTGFLIICALSLFLFTAIAGRLWCGFACPQTVYSQIFLWIEQKIEGNRILRLRLDQAAWTWEKLSKKTLKHALWLLLSAWTGLTFVGYFTPITQILSGAWALNLGGWTLFWLCFYSFATYGNAGFMREQVCKYMCPYARFQSAMFDSQTLIVSYDSQRGEPRRKPVEKVGSLSLENETKAGDCIDCGLCVQVCPVGIDIRNGLQYECIGCGVCIDACNTVMKKLDKPLGLIRLATPAIEHGLRWWRVWLRLLGRGRVLLYGGVLLGLCIMVFGGLFFWRHDFKVDVVRDRGVLARWVEAGAVENVYRLQIMNATEESQRYQLAVQGLPGLVLASPAQWEVPATQSRWIPVRVRLPLPTSTWLVPVPSGSHPIAFQVTKLSKLSPYSSSPPEQLEEKAAFVVPMR